MSPDDPIPGDDQFCPFCGQVNSNIRDLTGNGGSALLRCTSCRASYVVILLNEPLPANEEIGDAIDAFEACLSDPPE